MNLSAQITIFFFVQLLPFEVSIAALSICIDFFHVNLCHPNYLLVRFDGIYTPGLPLFLTPCQHLSCNIPSISLSHISKPKQLIVACLTLSLNNLKSAVTYSVTSKANLNIFNSVSPTLCIFITNTIATS